MKAYGRASGAVWEGGEGGCELSFSYPWLLHPGGQNMCLFGVRGLTDTAANQNTLGKRLISCPYRKSIHDFSVSYHKGEYKTLTVMHRCIF